MDDKKNKHKEIANAAKKYNLTYADNSLKGRIRIYPGDYYDIVIAKVSDFPHSFPLVFEVGGRIPAKADRHIYPSTGNFCLTTKAKEQILLKTRIGTLESFISIIVIPFLENNSFFEIKGEYLYGEYSHGNKGIFECYQEITNLKNPYKLIKFIENAISRIPIDKNSNCICGSNKKFRNCHKKNFELLLKIDSKVLYSDLNQIKNLYP